MSWSRLQEPQMSRGHEPSSTSTRCWTARKLPYKTWSELNSAEVVVVNTLQMSASQPLLSSAHCSTPANTQAVMLIMWGTTFAPPIKNTTRCLLLQHGWPRTLAA